MRKIFLLSAFMLCIFVISKPVFAIYESDKNSDVTSYDEWINDDGEYDFPITQYDDEWYELEDVVEMRSITQIPNELLNNILTADLLQLILKYPLLCDLNAFASVEDGYNHIKQQFNGIEELLSRDDAYEELIKIYKNYNLPSNRIVDYSSIIGYEETKIINEMCSDKEMRHKIYDDANIKDNIDVLECMIVDIIERKKIDTEEFVGIYINKAEQKKNSEYYKNENAYALFSGVSESDSDIFDKYIETYESKSSSTIVITTPSGVKVNVQYSSTLDMCDASDYMGLIAEYNASLISSASKTFNCHSYAWLSGLRTDYQHIWLTNSYAFCSDPYYESSSIAKFRDIAYYNNGAHSAIVISINRDDPYDGIDSPQKYCVSKWGAGPMVEHFLKRCPYYTSENTIKYYRPVE